MSKYPSAAELALHLICEKEECECGHTFLTNGSQGFAAHCPCCNEVALTIWDEKFGPMLDCDEGCDTIKIRTKLAKVSLLPSIFPQTHLPAFDFIEPNDEATMKFSSATKLAHKEAHRLSSALNELMYRLVAADPPPCQSLIDLVVGHSTALRSSLDKLVEKRPYKERCYCGRSGACDVHSE